MSEPRPGKELVPRSVATLVADVRALIHSARERVARTVDAGLASLNWRIGKRIREDLLFSRWAESGKQILATLSQELAKEYGRGYAPDALSRMINFTKAFPDARVVQTLSAQLGWSHFVELITVDDPWNHVESLKKALDTWNAKKRK